MDGEHVDHAPLCPRCRKPMTYMRSVPKLGALPELRTYQCRSCGETVTEAYEPQLSRADDPQAA